LATPLQPAPPEQDDTATLAPSDFAAPAPRAIPREQPVFGFLDVLLIALGAFLILVVVQTIGIGVARALPRFHGLALDQLTKEPLIAIPTQAVAYLLLLVFVHLLLFARYGRGLTAAVPFRWPRREWLALIAVGVVLAFAIDLLESFLPIPKQLPIDAFFKDRASTLLMVAFGILLAPVIEELFFRGLLYPVLNRALGAVASLSLTAALFALLHAGQLAHAWGPLFALFLVGLVLTLVRARYQSVAASILVHMAYNSTLFAFLYVSTGGFRHMEMLNR
jgi:uncharacterized protein